MEVGANYLQSWEILNRWFCALSALILLAMMKEEHMHLHRQLNCKWVMFWFSEAKQEQQRGQKTIILQVLHTQKPLMCFWGKNVLLMQLLHQTLSFFCLVLLKAAWRMWWRACFSSCMLHVKVHVIEIWIFYSLFCVH